MAQSEVEHSSVDVKLKRVDRIYRPGETVTGVVVVSARAGWAHKGISMRVTGVAKVQLSQRGLFESGAVKPREVLRQTVDVAPPGRVPDGASEFPFEFVVTAVDGHKLRESYHGVYVTVCYAIAVECRRGVMKNPLDCEVEFIVEVPAETVPPADPADFAIAPESLENVRASSLAGLPRFKITGKFHRKSCPINLPFTGELVIEESQAAVKSVDLQLVRSETVRHPESGNSAKESTEIQIIQIADGDITRNLVIPIYMIFPRLFTCPSFSDDNFKVDFEINLIVVFADGYMVTENFPIKLFRLRV